jgi:lipoyl(octanoyl) transferase
MTSGLTAVRAGVLDYQAAWDEQRRLHEAVVAGERTDTVLLLEHPSVYTAGKRTEPWDRPMDGTPVLDVDAAAKSPGTARVGTRSSGCPTWRTWSPTSAVPAASVDVCAEFGLATDRIEGRSGVWVPEDDKGPARKVAAIGIRVARGVTLHGFSLNCDCDLTYFDRIVPCGIRDAGVTSLTAELGRPVTVADALPVVERHLPTLVQI